MRFQRSFSPVGMTTSLISGLPRRDTCVQPGRTLPFTVTFWRSVEAQTPTVWLWVSISPIGICRAIVWTL